jgi:hypothetical protein
VTANVPGDADIAAYERDGFLVVRQPLFAPEKLARLEGVLRDWLEWSAAGRVPSDLNVPHSTDGRLFEFLADERLLDIIERLVGPDIAIWTSQFFCKAPRTGQAISWHADGHYWTRFLQPIDVVSIWLALDDVTAANGCLRVVRGSHRAGTFHYAKRGEHENPFFPRGVPEDTIDASQIVDVELNRGEFVLFDAQLLHGSQPNESTRPRRGYTMRYMPTRCSFDPVDRQPLRRAARVIAGRVRRQLTGRDIFRHRIYLARGEDKGGNRYTPWPPAAAGSPGSVQVQR